MTASGEALRAHETRKARLAAEFRGNGGPVRLDKKTSNLFRPRREASRRVNVRDFSHVLKVDAENLTAEVEGMTPYDALAAATLEHGLLPTVVPELRSITIGGAVSGIGIESTSFKYGLVHETVESMDVLLPNGDVAVCTPDNEYADLFHGLPNSYGTLGYILRLTVKLYRAKPYVRLVHKKYTDPERFYGDLRERAGDSDFLEGVVFGPGEMYITQGLMVDEAPWISDYTYTNIYYKSIREREEDYLTISGYIWRWDTDWFWCSKHVFAQNPIVRRLLGRRFLRSTTYWRLMRLNQRYNITERLNRWTGRSGGGESVIQDVVIPVERCPEFLAFFQEEIGVKPVWNCPMQNIDARKWTLFPTDPETFYVNFGFWDVIPSTKPEGWHNRRIEEKVAALGGVKSLYSSAYYPEDEFWRLYNGTAYDALKRQYDPEGRLKNLYEKCVLRS